MTIAGKIAELTEQLKAERVFANANLAPDHITMFILFGFDQRKKEALEQMVRDLVTHKMVAALLTTDPQKTIASLVKEALDAAGKTANGTLKDLNKIHFCTLIDAVAADSATFKVTVTDIERFRNEEQLQAEWKHFLIIDTDDPSASLWLEAVCSTIQMLGVSFSGRCCILTRKDERNFSVADSRLYSTALVLALLSAVDNIKDQLGYSIAFHDHNVEQYFYTAQSVVIADPTVLRTWSCVIQSLDILLRESGEKTEIDTAFVAHVLQPYYEQLPNEGSTVSLLPLYAIMNDEAYCDRLNDFAEKVYLIPFETGKETIFDGFLVGFLRAFVASKNDISVLEEIRYDKSKREKLLNSTRKQEELDILPLLPLTPKSKRIVISDIYDKTARSIIRKLGNVAIELLDSFFDSLRFAALPSQYREVCDLLRDMVDQIRGEEARLSAEGIEVRVDLNSNPDDRVVEETIRRLRFPPPTMGEDTAQPERCIVQVLRDLERGRNPEAEMLRLLVDVYKTVRSQIGGRAQSYMALLSRSCADSSGHYAQRCIRHISEKLTFPIRVQNLGQAKNILTWGDEENFFLNVWDASAQVRTRRLPISSPDHITILCISEPFAQKDILGVKPRINETAVDRNVIVDESEYEFFDAPEVPATE